MRPLSVGTVLLLALTVSPPAAGNQTTKKVSRSGRGSAEGSGLQSLRDGPPPPLITWYLGHCGFAVRVGTKLLIFDYLSDRGTPAPDPEAGGLGDGIIEPADLRGLDVYVFVTHSHTDHYDPVILEWEEEVEGIQYFFGWDAGDNARHHYLVGPRASLKLPDLEVYTINSHHSGVPEVAYLVRVDGHWIYHNGDYRQDYLQDFEYLGTLTPHMDLVFHVGLTDEVWQYTLQAHYLMDHFSPDAFFPMHFGGNEEEMAEFPRVMAERGYHTFIPLPRRRGDRWEIGGAAWADTSEAGPGQMESRPIDSHNPGRDSSQVLPPENRGGLFSRKAESPSPKSGDAALSTWARRSASSWSCNDE